MKDLKSITGAVLLKDIADGAHADVASSWLDVSGYNGAILMALVGPLTGVDGSNYLTLALQESNTTADGDATTVAAADVQGAFTVIDSASEDSVVQCVGYKGSKRYVRIKFDYTGTGISAGYIAAVGVVGHPISAPVTAPAAVAAT